MTIKHDDQTWQPNMSRFFSCSVEFHRVKFIEFVTDAHAHVFCDSTLTPVPPLNWSWQETFLQTRTNTELFFSACDDTQQKVATPHDTVNSSQQQKMSVFLLCLWSLYLLVSVWLRHMLSEQDWISLVNQVTCDKLRWCKREWFLLHFCQLKRKTPASAVL